MNLFLKIVIFGIAFNIYNNNHKYFLKYACPGVLTKNLLKNEILPNYEHSGFNKTIIINMFHVHLE